MKDYDFECWLLKYNGTPIYGRVYKKSSIKVTPNQMVPLLWNHKHDDPGSILGYAILEDRKEGVYVYGTLSDGPLKELAIKLILDRGSISVSPCVFHIKYDGNIITEGDIREVSFTPERVDPDEAYYPILRVKEDSND